MALNITSLDDLNDDLVAQLQAEFEQLVKEKHPEIAFQRGVFSDLIAYFSGGISGAANQEVADRLFQSGSLKDIEANPALADDEFVDRVLSNYRIERKPGDLATGDIQIRVSANETVVVQENLAFQANGLNFLVDEPYTARPVGTTPILDTDRVLTPIGDGSFAFSISATAAEVGEKYNIRRGTTMVPVGFPNNFVSAVAATDFKGGEDVELNSELITRLQEGIAAKVMQGRVNIAAFIKEQESFKDIIALSTVGYGNAEMMRDQHSIFPVSMGGRLDIYARTRGLPLRLAFTKSATLIGTVAGGSVWQFSINRDDFPGFYDVTQIILPTDSVDTAGFEITSDIRSFDLSEDTLPVQPDLVSIDEAFYTKYQTAVIQFVDTVTDTTGMVVNSTKQDYNIAIRGMPLIKELQDFAMDYRWRNLAADIAVKACVPCFLSINFDIQISAGSVTPDVTAIKNALVTEINNLGFPGQIHTSLVSDIVHGFLTDRQALGVIDLHGRINRPTGTFQIIRSRDVLRIPNDPGNMVSGRTTSFILEDDDIGISVITEGFTTGA